MTSVWIANCGFGWAQDFARDSVLVTNADYSIFSESERRFLSSFAPSYQTSWPPPTALSALQGSDVEITLREIELKKFGGESDGEFMGRANNLYSDLTEHPEIFQEKARSLSASRSRFRSGLLTPLTLNQLDPEVAEQVVNLQSSELTKPIKIEDSIFILRKEPIRLTTKPDQ